MTNNCTTPNKTLLSVSALAAILVATGTVAAFVAQPAAAQQYSIPTTTHQIQTCDTAGGASPIVPPVMEHLITMLLIRVHQ